LVLLLLAVSVRLEDGFALE
jgi:hypothetical protein